MTTRVSDTIQNCPEVVDGNGRNSRQRSSAGEGRMSAGTSVSTIARTLARQSHAGQRSRFGEPMIEQVSFPKAKAGVYWTASPVRPLTNPVSFWTVNFDKGIVGADRAYLVRCVKDQ